MNSDVQTERYSADAFSDIRLEENILGAILVSKKVSDAACELLTPEMFSDSTMRLIFSAAQTLVKRGIEPDMLNVSREAEKSDATGGLFEKITHMATGVVSTAVWEDWALALQSLYFKRRLYIALTEETGRLKAIDRDVFESIETISKLLDDVEQQALRNAQGKELPDILNNVEERILRRMDCKAKGIMPGINTGLNGLNNGLYGWQPSTLNILAARPSMGKTALMLHFAKTAAIYGSPALIFSLEMSDTSLAQRLVLSECEVSPDDVKSGSLTQKQFEEFSTARKRIEALPISIVERSGMEIDDLCRVARNKYRQKKCGIVFVDYLQLVTVSRTKNRIGNREQEVAYISRRLKGLAKDLAIPVVALAQLSRSVESRSDKRPVMSDLRESGAIEQDADTVIFVYRGEYYDDEKSLPGQGELLTEKNREGECGKTMFSYNPSMTKIRNVHGIPLSGAPKDADVKDVLPEDCPF